MDGLEALLTPGYQLAPETPIATYMTLAPFMGAEEAYERSMEGTENGEAKGGERYSSAEDSLQRGWSFIQRLRVAKAPELSGSAGGGRPRRSRRIPVIATSTQELEISGVPIGDGRYSATSTKGSSEISRRRAPRTPWGLTLSFLRRASSTPTQRS
jgi:hypothetical protein